jgi:hypothetical protein
MSNPLLQNGGTGEDSGASISLAAVKRDASSYDDVHAALVKRDSQDTPESYQCAFRGCAMLGIWVREALQEALRGAASMP